MSQLTANERIEKMKKLMIAVLGLTCMAGMAVAGSIDSPGAPGSAVSKMPAVGDIYNYLTTGTPVPTPGTSFTEPSAAPGSTGHTLTEIYAAVATPFPQCDAAVADVKSGKKFFCTQSGSWGVRTGTAQSGLLKTGQTSVYQTGDDGTYQKGVAFSYTNNGDGTVTDNATGLMWPQTLYSNGTGCKTSVVWSSAVNWAEGLVFASYSDWRLPNINELLSLVTRTPGSSPYINTTVFSVSGDSNFCWSSTTSKADTTQAQTWYATVYTTPSDVGKTQQRSAFVVRGGL